MAGDERWAAIEDVGRLRDGLGVPVPPGTPTPSPIPSTTRSPTWSAATPAPTARSPPTTSRPGSGSAPPSSGTPCSGWPPQGRVLDGEFRPVRLRHRVVRRRGAAPAAPPLAGPAAPGDRAGRAGHPGPVPPRLAARRRPAPRHRRRAHRDRPARRLPGAGLARWSRWCSPRRVRDYEPSYLDELTASGEVVWAGHAPLPGSRRLGRRCTSPTRRRSRCPTTSPFEHTELHQAVLDALAPGGAWFFRQLSDQVGSTNDAALSAALWDLVWAGRISNDTLAPLRALTRSGTPAHRSRRPPPAAGPRPGGRAAPGRPRPPAAGRCCRRSTPTRPGARTRPPSGCSTGTASSPAARW